MSSFFVKKVPLKLNVLLNTFNFKGHTVKTKNATQGSAVPAALLDRSLLDILL